MESAETGENSHGVRIFAHLRGVCEFGRCCAKFSHTPGAVVFQRPYLPHFSSKSYTVWSVGFLTYRALKWYIVCKNELREVLQKCEIRLQLAFLCFLHSVFPLSLLLSLHTLNDFGKGLWSSKAWFFMNLSSSLLCHGFQITLLNLGLFWWSNY